MANEYHDELGRFCSRDEMRKAVKNAALSGNTEVYLQLKQDLVEADKKTNYLPSRKHSTTYVALENKEQHIQERDNIIQNGTLEEAQQWMNNRIHNEDFHDLLDSRDTMKEQARTVLEEYKLYQEQYNKNLLTDYEIVREKGFEAQDAYEEYILLKNQVNEYKDITAPIVAHITKKTVEKEQADGTFKEYNEKELNKLQATGDFPSGSREWLEQRQKGIGGSDVGKIIGVNDNTSYDRKDYLEILATKLDPISEEQVEEQEAGHVDYTGYAGRGNAWEDYIAKQYANNNPDQNVTFCKTSWQHKDRPYQFANFDGLMTDENGHPNGILEIKTASDATKWGDPKLGLDGVPKQYRAQTLWYADAAGFDRGAVAVMIDDHEYREYHFTVTPELRKEMEQNRQKVETFVKTVDSIKKGETPDPRIPKDLSGREMFSKTFLDEARKGNNKSFEEAAILREETIEKTKKRFKALTGEDTSPENLRKAMHTLYTEKPLESRKRKWVHLDLETTTTSPTSGHIIEVGISVRDPQGKGEISNFQKLYGLPKRAVEGVGTGATEVHGITLGKIAKKRSFRHKEEQKKLLNILKSGTVVAHNATFEKRWLRQHLDGFATAEAKGEIKILDTRNITQRLLTNTKNASLESMCEEFGIEYVDAHRAYNDSNMMGQALDAFLIRETKKN